MNEMTQRLECRVRKGKVLAIILLMPLPAVFCCAIIQFKFDIIFVTCLIAAAFAAFWLRMWHQLLSSSLAVIVDEVGIEDRRNGLGIILWEDIQSMTTMLGREGWNIQLHVYDETKYLSILKPIQKRWVSLKRLFAECDSFVVDCFSIRPTADEVLRCMRQFHAQSLAHRQS